MRDLKFIVGLLLLCLLILIAVDVVIGPVYAISTTSVTPDITPIFVNSSAQNMTELINHTYEIHRIGQGDKVYLGDHIDISGVVAGNLALAWFSAGEPVLDAPPYVMPLPKSKSGWYDFYVDPAIFADKLGNWYKWNGAVESNGNTHAFWVSSTWRNATLTYPNGTVMMLTNLTSGNYTVKPPEIKPLLPEVNVADYLITQGDALNITVNKTSALWIFCGNDNSVVYEKDMDTTHIVVNETTIQNLIPGRYKIIIQSIGNVSPYLDVSYAGNNSIKWFDRSTFAVHIIDLNGMTPDTAVATLEEIFPQTNDVYDKYTLIVERPAITIDTMDKVGVGASKDYYKIDDSKGNVSLMDVRGYTNVLPGTPISVVLDLDHTTPRDVKYSTFNGTAIGTAPGNKRYYQVYVPLYEDSLYIGDHSLTAFTSLGGSMRAEFPVTVMPADSYQDAVTVKWIGNQSPWVPTPTPEIVKVPYAVPGPERTIVVIQTPSPEEIHTEAQKITDEQAAVNTRNNNLLIVGAVVMFGVAWIGWAMWRARKGERKGERK